MGLAVTTTKTWNFAKVSQLYTQPLFDLVFQAQTTHRLHHDPNAMQLSNLLSIKTGACPEDCGYCSQSGHHKTHVEKEQLMSVDEVLVKAKEAKSQGAQRFCMGAAWRSPPDKAIPKLKEMIASVKSLGLETCMTLGMLSQDQANALSEAGLDYYNHNIDTSPGYYEKVVTTRKFSDRLTTLDHVKNAGINVCCGGIMGLGESQDDRIEFLLTLANMAPPPQSVPINRLIAVKGTPMGETKPLDNFELIRTIATARILMPKSAIRLSAGRTEMSEEMQAFCFFSGANSIFIGDKLLTEDNPEQCQDFSLMSKLGLKMKSCENECT